MQNASSTMSQNSHSPIEIKVIDKAYLEKKVWYKNDKNTETQSYCFQLFYFSHLNNYQIYLCIILVTLLLPLCPSKFAFKESYCKILF